MRPPVLLCLCELVFIIICSFYFGVAYLYYCVWAVYGFNSFLGCKFNILVRVVCFCKKLVSMSVSLTKQLNTATNFDREPLFSLLTIQKTLDNTNENSQ